MPDRFSANPAITWYRSPIDKAVLAGLLERNNFRGWVQTLCHLAWFATTAALAYGAFTLINTTNWMWSIPLLVLALFVHGTMGPFMGLVAIHELQHRTVFKSRWLNHLFEQIYAFISWSDYIWYQQSHAIHHRATCHAQFDGEVQLPLRFSLRKGQFWLSVLAWNPSATWSRLTMVWHHARGQVDGDWYQYVLPESDTRLRKRHRNWARTLLVGHALLAIVFVATGHWFLLIVVTFGTFYCSWLGFLMGTPQHFGLNSNVPDFRLNTRTFTCSWLTAFYYWNMQYHLEHHMFPAVPFYNLPKLRKQIEQDLPPATHGLIATWQQLLAIRNHARADPTFHYLPALPETAAIAAP